jgi:hypothetical protein
MLCKQLARVVELALASKPSSIQGGDVRQILMFTKKWLEQLG